jgi:hypothetical protein
MGQEPFGIERYRQRLVTELDFVILFYDLSEVAPLLDRLSSRALDNAVGVVTRNP